MSKGEADEDQGIISTCFQTPPRIVHIVALECVGTHSERPHTFQVSADSQVNSQR